MRPIYHVSCGCHMLFWCLRAAFITFFCTLCSAADDFPLHFHAAMTATDRTLAPVSRMRQSFTAIWTPCPLWTVRRARRPSANPGSPGCRRAAPADAAAGSALTLPAPQWRREEATGRWSWQRILRELLLIIVVCINCCTPDAPYLSGELRLPYALLVSEGSIHHLLLHCMQRC